MADKDLPPSPLFKLNEHQIALEAAIMELVLWVEQQDRQMSAGTYAGR